MKKFEFSLATLLEVRSKKVNLAHQELLDAQIVLQKMLNTLENLEIDRYNIKLQIRDKQMKNRALMPKEIASYFEYLLSLGTHIAKQKNLISEANNSLEIRRQALIAAMQKRKIIENLQEKKREEWENEFLEQEKAFFDELSTMRYNHEKRQNLDHPS